MSPAVTLTVVDSGNREMLIEPPGGEIPLLSRGTPAYQLERAPPTSGPSRETDNQIRETREQDNTETIHEMNNKKSIRLGTYNIRGKGHNERYTKYRQLTQWMRINKIAIIAVQETKLNDNDINHIEKENPRSQILANNGVGRSAGVAFILNKDMTSTWKTETTTIIPGRAMSIQITYDKLDLTITNIYSPNDTHDKIAFYNEINNHLKETRINNEHIIMGDFNFVENAIDRIPMHMDDKDIIIAFNNIKTTSNLIDVWRNQNESEKQFTYTHNTYGSLARIDRIYASRNTQLCNWTFEPIGNLSDHKLVKCEYEYETEVYVGKGLWRLPMQLLKEPHFVKEATKIITKTHTAMSNDQAKHKQTIWKETKIELKECAIRVQREIRHQKEKKIKEIKKRQRQAIKLANEEQTKKELNQTDKEWANTNQERLEAYRVKAKAKHLMEGERNTKYWYNLGKERREPSIIHSLNNEQGQTKSMTRDMANIAKDFYKKLSTAPQREEDFETKAEELLDNVDKCLNDAQITELDQSIREAEVRKAISDSENGKSPGIDGFPLELYKLWLNPKKETDPSIAKILTKVYNEIEQIGLIPDSDFNEGTMFLLFKKGDKKMIGNYRPLTLSNTDYKIMTKTIATRLGRVAGDIIHPNQTGFIPKRNLYDNTKLSETMITYTSIKGENGCILALDQEKAYDRIAHDYLWMVLEKFGFPPSLIRTIRSLYKEARTRIMVNGVSPGYIILYVGVKQGCPMSCLLYDIAIEPLACSIRRSKLIGFRIQGLLDRIIISMFADDTIIYLNMKDDLVILFRLLDNFCYISNARFNKHKYEALPIGTRSFIEELIRTRKLNDKPNNQLPLEVKIIKIGEPMRTLGAWIGHEIDQYPLWNKIIEKQIDIMKTWSRKNLSFKGKELILKALITSRAFFLATVNGIPNDIIEIMHKEMANFLWDGKRSTMTWKQVIMPRSKGGLSIPDLHIRKEAIIIKWIKQWLSNPETRPTWAHVIDQIIFENIAPEPKIEAESRMNWILQTWHEIGLGGSTLPTFVKDMTKVARKYNIGFDALKISQEMKSIFPLWHHIGANSNYLWNKKAAKCLRNNHQVRLIGEIEDYLIDQEPDTDCENHSRCQNIANTLSNHVTAKFNLNNTTPRKDNLDFTPRRKKALKEINYKERPITFNPDVTAKGHPHDHIRIFSTEIGYKTRRKEKKWKNPLYRLPPVDEATKTIYVKGIREEDKDGSNHEMKIGIYINETDPRNEGVIIKEEGDATRAELRAILRALNIEGPLIIKCNSEQAIDLLIFKIEALEDEDWLETENKDIIKAITQELRKRGNITQFQYVDKKDQSLKEAKKLADEATIEWSTEIRLNHNFDLKGARLSILRQDTSYKLILRDIMQKKGFKETIGGTKTQRNLSEIRNELRTKYCQEISIANIWKDILKIEIKKFQDFIWKSIHGRIKCGSFFLMIPTMMERAYCKCNAIESEEHIILECKVNNSKETWDVIKETWTKLTLKQWPDINMNSIRSIGSIRMKGDKNIKSQAATEIFRLLVSSTSWCLWKNRNRRIFDEIITNKDTLRKIVLDEIKDLILIEWECTRLAPWDKQKKLQDRFKEKWKRGIKLERVNNEPYKLIINL